MLLPGGTWLIRKRMVSRGTAVLMAGERRPLGFVSKRQRTLRSAAPAAAGRRGGCPRSSTSLGLRAELFCARAAFAGSRRFLLSWDTQSIGSLWAHTLDQKTVLNGNMSYKCFGSRLKGLSGKPSVFRDK